MIRLQPVLARLMRLRACAMLACAAALLPAPASAQTRSRETATASSRAIVLSPLSFLNTRDMEFGRIAATGAGTVVVSPVTNACTTSAGVLRIGTCRPAEFTGRGVLNLITRVRINERSINLTGPGAPMLLDAFTIDGAPTFAYVGPGQGFVRYRILSPSGIFSFRVGGTLHVNANQQPGVYAGSFTVRADYQ